MSTNMRNGTVDWLKATAAICVILGHAMQYSGIYQTNSLFKYIYRFIYSFHMPLFALISGFLVVETAYKSKLFSYIVKRCRIVFPILVYSFIPFILDRVFDKEEGLILNLRHFVGYICIGNGTIWFLRVILISVLILGSILRLAKKEIVLVVSAVFSFLMPSNYWLSQLGYIYFFAVIGALVNLYSDNLYKLDNQKKRIMNSVIFVIMLLFYEESMFIYNGRWGVIADACPIEIVAIDLYRILIGISGCYLLYSLIKGMKSNSFITMMSRESLAIYCISLLITVYLTKYLPFTNLFINCILILLGSAIGAIVGVVIFNKSRITRLLFLGHK